MKLMNTLCIILKEAHAVCIFLPCQLKRKQNEAEMKSLAPGITHSRGMGGGGEGDVGLGGDGDGDGGLSAARNGQVSCCVCMGRL